MQSRTGISLRQLRYFIAIAEARSFSAASRSLHVSQPALGLQVRELEERLGVRLLTRHARGVDLTEAGRVFLPRARDVADAMTLAEQSVAAFRGSEIRDVTLGVTPTIGRALVGDFLGGDAQGEAPAQPFRLHLREGLTSDLLLLLRGGDVDAAFCYEPPADAAYECHALYDEDLFVVGRAASAGPVIGLSDLASLPLALGAPEDASRLAIERCANGAGVSLDIRIEIAPIALKREMLIRRGLFAIVPYGLFLPDIDLGLLQARRIEPPIRRRMTLAIRRDLPDDIRHRLLELARAGVSAQAERGDLGWKRLV